MTGWKNARTAEPALQKTGQPQTIEELRRWYIDHNLPPEEVTRFFIGKDIREPKAFGIYQNDGGDFVVYKNKADGERAVRYQGSDEGYAVNELYQRLRAEIADQRKANQDRRSASEGKKPAGCFGGGCLGMLTRPVVYISIVVFFVAGIIGAILDKTPSNGYYNYNGDSYYRQGSSWYRYDTDTDDWYHADNESELDEAITEDTEDDYSVYGNEGKDFEDSTWYDAGSNSDDSSDWDNDSSWDDDDDWDSGWDSGGGTDWDSDW